ncbi:MAG: hypothetical protein KF814_07850 [Nitrospiraceae bacterium]|nr:hypothetical protein [Nitrospiraceae bacterium]
MTILVWGHLLAAVVWIGGMVFLSLVLVPVLRQGGQFAQHASLFRTVALRFRSVVWGAMAMLVGSGIFLAAGRAIPLTDPAHWPTIFVVKISLVSVLLSLTFLHDLVVGPGVRRVLAVPEAQRSKSDRMWLRYSALVPRLSLLLALAVLFLAVQLARS